ncbi:aromatic-ring hydroxylase C-terminal domain-containing protein [Nocardia sputi]|uniref:aromatic-ring hydroxylase C-terminal domain-containing protein n=1 Tax=Nocardia sputi TaxID=2943705 RepID=UPI0035577E9E
MVASNENPNGLPALRVRHIDGDMATFTDIAGIGPNGAFLVRPDHFVAWRSPAPHLTGKRHSAVVGCRQVSGGRRRLHLRPP